MAAILTDEMLPQTIDNVSCRLGDDIAARLSKDSTVYVASNGFSLAAFEHLADKLENARAVRFVFTAPAFVPQNAVKEKLNKERREFFIPGVGEASVLGTEYEIRLRNRLMQKAVARRCANWIRKGNIRFASVGSYGAIQDMFIIETPDGSSVYVPFQGFTADVLGFERGEFQSAISTRMGGVVARTYLTRFKEIWAGGDVSDVTGNLLDYIANVYRDNEPELVYFLVLKYLFEEALQDFDADSMPNSAVGFEDSAVWKMLFDFQHDAAIAIINKLEKYNGCILADSVGLGKTFTALAVIRYYELRNKNVLVLCPKKLEENWNVYNKPMYKNNPFASEKLRYDVLCHTDIQRERGQSNGMDLSKVNWGGYDLVVIDESHNFRNDKSEYLDRETRYQSLMRKVMREGVKTKVLMLSATPVNNRFNDLKNQLRLAYGGGADEMNKILGTSGRTVEAIFRDAEHAFDEWSENKTGPRTAEALFRALPSDFLELLDAVTIARSRKHIERFYNTSAIGKFPTHLPAQSEMCPISTDSGAVRIKELNDLLIARSFCAYTPSQYILPSHRQYYDELTATHTRRGGTIHQAGREYTLKNLMVINVLKRLESSVYSFRKTLTAILAKNEALLWQLEAGSGPARRTGAADGETSQNLNVAVAPDEIEGFEDEDEIASLAVGQYAVNVNDLDVESYKRDLKADIEAFRDILEKIRPIDPAHDAKLKRLKELIVEKTTSPFNPGNKKLLIFSAFADTAGYLYRELSPLLEKKFGIHCGLVTGKDAPKATIKLDAPDFQEVLSRFSPVSKERPDFVALRSGAEMDDSLELRAKSLEPHMAENGRASRPATAADMEHREWGAADSAASCRICRNALSSKNTACGQEPRSGRRVGGTPLPSPQVAVAAGYSQTSNHSLTFSPSYPLTTDNCTLNIGHCKLKAGASCPPQELDVLFATDCVSEGQNLQDCDCVVNYDIHWNPVRIIQRFGRVDRIGSKNETVKLVNFWPDVDLNEYINLTERVKNRMQAVNIAGAGHDNPLAEGDGVDFRDEPLTRMMNGEIVDMESLKTGVSITDLGLNEYALALKKYMEANPGMGTLPPGINAVIEADPEEGLVPGVIFFLRNRDEKLRNETNYFHPFYTVYLSASGDVIKDSSQGKAVIELLRKGCEGKSEPITSLCREFNKETKDGFRMERYSELLTKAIETIAAKKEESDVESLFSSTETTALNGDCSHLDAFELMAFFVVKEVP